MHWTILVVQTVDGSNTNMVQMNLNHLPGFCVQDSVQTQMVNLLPKKESCVEKQCKRMSREDLLQRRRAF